MSIDRRSFLKSSIATGLALGFPAIATAQRDKVYRTALIGSGWWGTNILREAAASGRCKITALVDVDRRQLLCRHRQEPRIVERGGDRRGDDGLAELAHRLERAHAAPQRAVLGQRDEHHRGLNVTRDPIERRTEGRRLGTAGRDHEREPREIQECSAGLHVDGGRRRRTRERVLGLDRWDVLHWVPPSVPGVTSHQPIEMLVIRIGAEQGEIT